MGIRLLFSTVIVVLFQSLFAHDGCNTRVQSDVSSDLIITALFQKYQEAILSKDTTFSDNYFVSDAEYEEVFSYVKSKQPNCIGSDEQSFSAYSNKKVYLEVLNSSININQLHVDKIEYNNSCGNLLVIPRVICSVKYNNTEVIEVPFLLIKTMKGDYKIIRNFLNLKFFTHE